jgi:maltooligosyltrehalose trehalohydrolase
MNDIPIHLPQGAIRQPDGGVQWRVWAPNCKRLYLVLLHGCQTQRITMQREGGGYYVHHGQADDGQRYCYALPDNHEVPDPASRWQPDGVHKP